MRADGSGEKVLTSGPIDDVPSWGANSRELLFQRTGAEGRSAIFRLTTAGGAPQKLVTPQDGSDPDWSAQRE